MKNTLMSFHCKSTKDGKGVWLEIYEVGCEEDACASFYMGIPDLMALSEYLRGFAKELEYRRAKEALDKDRPVRHEYDPNVKHIDEYFIDEI